MKLLVVSDTHGDYTELLKAVKKIKGLDALVHLGDYATDGDELGEILGVTTYCVTGNCDLTVASIGEAIMETEFGEILLVHGHRLSQTSPDKLSYLAEDKGCKAVFFGHTHRALSREVGGIHVLNPGSASRPRDGGPGSYAVVTTTANTFAANIVRLNEKTAGGDVSGGFIKDLLNNSDRF